MRFGDVLRRSGRSLRTAKVRTLLTAIALAVGGFTLTATLAAANGAKAYTNRLIETNFDPSSIVVAKDKSLFGANGGFDDKPKEYDSSLVSVGARGGALLKQLTTTDLDKIQAIPGVTTVIPEYQLNAQYVTRTGEKKYTAALAAYNPAQKPEIKAGKLADSLPAGHILIPDDYVTLLHFGSAAKAVGQQLTVQVQQLIGLTEAHIYIIDGVTVKPATSISEQAGQILLNNNDIAGLHAYVNKGTTAADSFLAASVHIQNGTDSATLAKAKHALKQAGYAAETVADTQKLLGQVINILQGIVLGFGVITLIASFFGVVNTQYISVLERTREIGLMKALGMSRRTVSRLFIVEATWIGFIGAVLGCAAAFGLGTLLNPWISKKLSFGSEHLLIFKPVQIAALIVFLMLITTVAGLLPARKAARLDPIEALRTE